MIQPPQKSPSSQPDPSGARSLLGQFLVFIGPIIFAGGFLAIWRTGQQSWFYALLGVSGLMIWGVGVWLLRRKDTQ